MSLFCGVANMGFLPGLSKASHSPAQAPKRDGSGPYSSAPFFPPIPQKSLKPDSKTGQRLFWLNVESIQLTTSSGSVYFGQKVGGSGKLLEPKENDPISHIPVLVDEIISWLVQRPDARYLDCTLGQGGLASKILARSGPQAMLIGIDRDEEAIATARSRLQPYAGQARFVHGDFADLKHHLASLQLQQVDGVVFDLGVSSAQLDQPGRGFSFLSDGPLDMRMDRSHGPTAAELVNQLPESELADLIYRFGEERYSRRIARGIVQARAVAPLTTTLELASVIRTAVPGPYRYGRIHCATRTFQALRVAVNREIDVLEPAFRAAAEILAPGGRLCIISFHSLEDRVAKQTIKALSQGPAPLLIRKTKKPLTPSQEECRTNPRARSAKLRVAERRSP